MSNSIIILKKIEYFSYKNVLYQIQQAAKQANLFCIFIHSYFERHLLDFQFLAIVNRALINMIEQICF